MKKKFALLRNLSLLSGLDDKEIREIAKHSISKKYKKGEILFKKGSTGKELFIVEKGEVLVFKETSEGNRQILASYIEGKSFNEMSLFEDIPEQATAQAEIDTQLVVFDRNALNEIMTNHSPIAARMLHKLLCKIAERNRMANNLLAEQTKQSQDIKEREVTDQLTGLYNRGYLEEQLETELPNFGDHISIIIFKPDGFKAVNDTYGHVAGDNVLKIIAKTIAKNLRKKDKIIRYRGNEFVIILPHTEKFVALKIGEKLKKQALRMKTGEFTLGKNLKISASIGVACYPEQGTVIADVIQKGYNVMQKIMTDGGNRVDFV